MGRTALVLGGGLGGIAAAERLRALLPKTDRVILVEREPEHVFPPSLLWILDGSRRRRQVSRSYSDVARRGIEIVTGDVRAIDPAARSAQVGASTLTADAMVIALGAELAPQAVPGLAEAGYCLYTLEGAESGHAALERFGGGRVIVLTAVPQYKCPAAPYEAALLTDAFLRARGLREKSEIDFYAAEPAPMVVAGPEMGRAVRGLIEGRGIRYHPEQQIESIDDAHRTLRIAGGATAPFDLLLYVPPHRAPAPVREAGLTNESGWIPVDRHTLQTRFENVFAIGDVVSIPLKMGRPLPKAGVFANGEAEVVAHNIAQAWTGKGSTRRFEGSGMCFIETGRGRAGMGSGDFYAEPTPRITVRAPSLLWHGAKVLHEKYWLHMKF